MVKYENVQSSADTVEPLEIVIATGYTRNTWSPL